MRKANATYGTEEFVRCSGSFSPDDLPLFGSVFEAVSALRPEEPLRCIFPDILKANAAEFLSGFPGLVFYALKSNPDPYVLSALYQGGIRHFDVASLGEIDLIHSLFPDAHMAFMHPVKSHRAIRAAYFEYGLRDFVIDSFDELEKIRKETDEAKDLTIIVRIGMPKGSALCSLSGKFGVAPEEAVLLLRKARQTACRIGLSFHIGSQSLDPLSYADAIRTAARVIEEAGEDIGVFDVGGGFPIPYLGVTPPPLGRFFDEISSNLKSLNLPKECEIWAEPGRALSGTGEVLVVRVELRRGQRLHINDGSFGNMFEVCSMNWKNRAEPVKPDGSINRKANLIGFELMGPTCDSVDHMRGPFLLPDTIKEGDWIALYGMGAYMAASRSGFNGFKEGGRVAIQGPTAKSMGDFTL